MRVASKWLSAQPTDPAALGGSRLKTSKLYDSGAVDNPLTRLAYSRVFAGMRINDRTTAAREIHLLTKQLYAAGRLLRCYTQEVNGLHTRDCPGMTNRVVEIHGTNAHLRCSNCHQRPNQPTTDFDEQLLRDGHAPCTRCNVSRHGRLLPDVLLHDEASKLWMDAVPSKWPAVEDVRCDVLLLLGPRLESRPTARLIRRLASLVHSQHNVVVHVGWKTPDHSTWGEHVDLHIESDVGTWASLYREQSSKVSGPDNTPDSGTDNAQLAQTVVGVTARALVRLVSEAHKAQEQSRARLSETHTSGEPTAADKGGIGSQKRVRFSV
ncbi:hypothetical protein FRC08_014426 [Ceratobasidium sp. 394]|nr:hypothetical protein FRC08_014426 [Ceratobasidium sp. 394]